MFEKALEHGAGRDVGSWASFHNRGSDRPTSQFQRSRTTTPVNPLAILMTWGYRLPSYWFGNLLCCSKGSVTLKESGVGSVSVRQLELTTNDDAIV
jgi:hypothetical protein